MLLLFHTHPLNNFCDHRIIALRMISIPFKTHAENRKRLGFYESGTLGEIDVGEAIKKCLFHFSSKLLFIVCQE